MAKINLSKRENWQTESGKKALNSENIFFNVFQDFFSTKKYNHFEIIKKPKNFNEIYNYTILDAKTEKEIYNINPNSKNAKWGFTPDFAIKNKKTGKVLFIEVKNQDGWIESGKQSDGRGNAHERSCKFFTPGLKRILQEESKISKEFHPLWLVLTGNITKDPKRNREIRTWYYGIENNYFMWRDLKNTKDILNHFIKKLSHFLD